MVILVAVTINVAMQGGIFDRAKSAADRTQKQADREELLAAVTYALDPITGKVKETELQAELGENNWQVIDNGDGTITCSKGLNVFIVNKDTATIEEGEGRIIIGTTSLSMRSTTETGEISGITLIGLAGNITWTSSDESVATVVGNNEGATVTAVADGNAVITASLNGKTATCNVTVNLGWIDNGDGTYTKGTETVTIGTTTYTTQQVKEKLGITVNSGTYTGTWTVIGIENGKLKLVSTSNSGSNIVLGKSDPRATDSTVEDHLPTTATDLEKAVWSYNHAIDTLDLAAKDQTGIASARSIRIEDIERILNIQDSDKGSDFGKIYKYYWDYKYDGSGYVYSKNFAAGTTDAEIDDSWLTTSRSTAEFGIFISVNGTIILDENNTNASTKQINTCYSYSPANTSGLGCLANDNYTIATLCTRCDPGRVLYNIAYMVNGEIGSDGYFFDSAGYNISGMRAGVRAIVYI